MANPPKAGERPEILNQIAETARVRDIAEMVAKLFDAEVQMVANPRQEDAENELVVANQKFKLLGLDPILLESAEGLFKEVTEIANKYLGRVDRSRSRARRTGTRRAPTPCSTPRRRMWARLPPRLRKPGHVALGMGVWSGRGEGHGLCWAARRECRGPRLGPQSLHCRRTGEN